MAGRGRSLRSPGRDAAILAALKVGNTRRAACRAAEISDDTLRRWMHRDPAFEDAVLGAEAEGERRAVGRIAIAASEGDWKAAAWFLERRYPAEWGRRSRVELALDVEREAARIAAESGLDVADLLAAVERLLRDGRASEG